MLSSSPAPRKNMKNLNGQNIKVFVRVRPAFENEKISRSHICIDCPPTNRDVVVQEKPLDKHTKKFSYDRVFSSKSTQLDVYKHVAKPLVDEVLKGFNCTIFAYGQTGTGKTHTMEGAFISESASATDENASAGIIPRCVNQLFDELRMRKLEFTMRVSFLELYNEELFDLLSAHDDLSKLRLYEDSTRKGSCIIQGLEEVLVRNKSDVYNIIEKGSAKRQTAATLMNAHSSRSHTVFTITVFMKENTVDGDELVKTGKLHLVDLAGSENIGKSGAVDKRAREAGNINQSLLTLGRVITSLVEKAPHVPYRESKLTRLLQDALGGRTKTSIIATISPVSTNIEETLSTLDYACRAKNIQNRPEVNQRLNKKELIGEYSNEIEKLRRDLLAMREKNGVYLANENYQEMIGTIEHQNQEITEKIAEIRALELEKERHLEMFAEIQNQLVETNEKLASTEIEKGQITERLECTQQLLVETADEREEQKFLVDSHVKTESEFQLQAKDLLNAADSASDDVKKLHDKCDRKRKVEEMNKILWSSFENEFSDLMSSAKAQVGLFKENHERKSSHFIEDLRNYLTLSKEESKNLSSNFKSIDSSVTDAIGQIRDFMKDKLSKICMDSCSSADNVQKDISSEMESMDGFLMDAFNPLIKSLENHLSEEQRRLNEFHIGIQPKVAACIEYIQSSHATVNNLLESLYTPISSIEKLPSILQNHFDEKSREMEEILKLQKEKLLMVMDSNDRLTSSLPLLPDVRRAQLNSISQSSKEIEDGVKKLMDHSEQQLAWVKEHENSITAAIETNNNEAETKIAEIQQELLQLNSSVNDRLSAQRSSLTSIMKLSQLSRLQIVESTDAAKKDMEQKSENISSVTTMQVDANLVALNKQTEQLESELRDQEDRIYRMKTELNDYLSDQMDHIDEYNDAVQQFYKEKLVEDFSTGLTPVRKEYSYPTSIAATSPHERILARYRKLKNRSKIPLPIEHEEETNIGGTEILEDLNNTNTSELSPDNNSTANSSGDLISEFLVPNTQLIPPTLNRQGSKEDQQNVSSLSRSSSTSSISAENEKENKNNRSRSKKRELRQPSALPTKIADRNIGSTSTTRSRRVLGSFN